MAFGKLERLTRGHAAFFHALNEVSACATEITVYPMSPPPKLQKRSRENSRSAKIHKRRRVGLA